MFILTPKSILNIDDAIDTISSGIALYTIRIPLYNKEIMAESNRLAIVASNGSIISISALLFSPRSAQYCIDTTSPALIGELILIVTPGSALT